MSQSSANSTTKPCLREPVPYFTRMQSRLCLEQDESRRDSNVSHPESPVEISPVEPPSPLVLAMRTSGRQMSRAEVFKDRVVASSEKVKSMQNEEAPTTFMEKLADKAPVGGACL